MNLALAIVLIIAALLIGLVGGFYGARAYMKKYFQDNPPISEDMIVAMMSQMGQKPSAKKVNQVMNMMKHQQR
ncbi:YneF family protein [Lactobacillus sp. LL6]|uniref:YneF family protein n=1 Tax=unclassified Lactobacillus TaxID=2620435 RepID=UPI0011871B5F|nr:YneF family protein [Lactobacillus sp. LL6]TSO26478.1 YneF family protein [Lactobacillus sp. LL6]